MKNMVKNKNGGEIMIHPNSRPWTSLFYRIWVSQYHKGISYMSNTEKIDAW